VATATGRALSLTARCSSKGCTPIFLPQAPEETFFRAFVHEEFDVSELSLSNYTMRRAKSDCPYIGIPVFIFRTCRHSAIYVRTDRGINRPEDMRGRLVGVPEYQQTAAVWIRGTLQDDYGARSVPTPADPGRAVRAQRHLAVEDLRACNTNSDGR
jgi:4,5-dihydroxyphthalate decarboxylase